MLCYIQHLVLYGYFLVTPWYFIYKPWVEIALQVYKKVSVPKERSSRATLRCGMLWGPGVAEVYHPSHSRWACNRDLNLLVHWGQIFTDKGWQYPISSNTNWFALAFSSLKHFHNWYQSFSEIVLLPKIVIFFFGNWEFPKKKKITICIE